MAPSCLLLGHKKRKIQGKNSGLSCNCQMFLGGLPHTFTRPFSPPPLVVQLGCFHDTLPGGGLRILTARGRLCGGGGIRGLDP